MRKIDTIIFDLDGTLLDTLEDLKNSVVYVQERYGFPVHDLKMVRKNVGNGVKKLIERSIPEGKDNPVFEEAFRIFKEHYQVHCNDTTDSYPGIMEMIKELKQQGYCLAIVSNKPDLAVKELNRIFFKEYITVAIGENEEEGIRKKPAPDSVLKAISLLSSTPERSIYVGDSEVDIATAANAGIEHVLCEWGFRDKDFLIEQGGRNFIKQPKEIFSFLQEIPL